jgi:hypothetical protein
MACYRYSFTFLYVMIFVPNSKHNYMRVSLEVFTAMTMKNGVFWDVSEELSASFIRVTRIGELGTTLAVTSNRRTQRVSVASYS